MPELVRYFLQHGGNFKTTFSPDNNVITIEQIFFGFYFKKSANAHVGATPSPLREGWDQAVSPASCLEVVGSTVYLKHVRGLAIDLGYPDGWAFTTCIGESASYCRGIELDVRCELGMWWLN